MKRKMIFSLALATVFLIAAIGQPIPKAQADNPNPPDTAVKLIFIHHSTGENWLTDGYGDLGSTLGENNYFVSDTNYGWGPNSIGDRTDIPNWTEWFRSDDTPRYMEALFEESGQNSSYTRTLSDPGGENEIIMFKSCFPNSELDGNPNDLPGTYEDYTVSGAKYVYNQILQYFATRPDKLFIVITAPPVSDSTFAENARAFNNWLMYDWLDENNYTGSNVAVFDFYNVLTDRNAHHWYHDGSIEHATGSRNTLYYPSEDDHPSVAGSQKATDEFVPLLNIFYNRWRAGAPAQPPAQPPEEASPEPEETQPPISGQVTPGGVIDDFESGTPAGTVGWEANWDRATSTTLSCSPVTDRKYAGNKAMQIDFNVAANSWALCSLFYEEAQDLSAGDGLNLYLYAEEAGLVFDVDIYIGDPDNLETYIYTIEAPPDSAEDWVSLELYWWDFHRADWEENAGVDFSNPERILGIAIGFETYPDTPNTGTIWIDNIQLIGAESQGGEQPEQPSEPEETEEGGGRRGLPCGASLAFPLALAGAAWFLRRK